MFRVTKKFDPRGSEILVNQFNDEQRAIVEIQKRLTEDALMKVNAIYSLYEGFDLIKEYNQSTLPSAHQEEQNSSGGKGSTQSFRPSPLQTSPRPSGMPPSSWKKEDDQDKE